MEILRTADASAEDITLLQDTQARIEDLFLIVIAGEFNSGKSTLLNALLGYALLPSGVLPTTSKICIVRSQADISTATKSSKYFTSSLEDSIEERFVNVEWLDNVALVDTPGTNSINAHHEQLTKLIIPRADLVYFVTSAERPMSESERVFLSLIHTWGKKISVVVNKIDVLTADEQASVMSFVQQEAGRILRESAHSLHVFGLSGRKALQALELAQKDVTSIDPANELWRASRLETLYQHILTNLKRGDLIQAKLENPLVTSEKLLSAVSVALSTRQTLIEGDERILEMISENNEAFAEDIQRDVKTYRLHIEGLCNKMLYQFDEFLEAEVSVFKLLGLLDVNAFQDKFKQQSVQSMSVPVEEVMKDIAALIAQRSKSHLKGVLAFIGDRHRRISGSMVGSVNESDFESNRAELFSRLEKEAVKLMRDKDPHKFIPVFGQHLSATAKGSLFSFALSGLVITLSFDVSGLLAMSGVALAGLVLVPWRKQAIKAEFKSSVQSLKSNLDMMVSTGLEQELTNVMVRIQSTIDPYSRFVRIEKSKIAELSVRIVDAKEEIKRLKADIKALQ